MEPQKLYDHLAQVELQSYPGEAEAYSNLGFGLLGHVLEEAAKKPLHQLLDDWLCQPLDLRNTGIEGLSSLKPATGYASQIRGGGKRTHSLKERLAGSGGLVTTTEDLGKFLIAQMEPGVLSEATLAELQSETLLSSGRPSGKTLGWSLRILDEVGGILEKNGGRSNCTAWVGFSPEYQTGVAMFSNCGGPDVEIVGRVLLEKVIPPSSWKPGTRYGYARVAPFSGVRWQNNLPVVLVGDDWWPLVSIDDILVEHIMKFAQKNYGDRARKRFAEDLVEVLDKMGHEPDRNVMLELRESDESTRAVSARMTAENRSRVRSGA